MKKSKRYNTRYSAKKRHVEDLTVALECNQRIVAEQRKQISELLAKMAKAEDSAKPTVTTVRIGPVSGPGFRYGKMLGLNLVINIDEFFYYAESQHRGGVWDISRIVELHCQEVAHKLRAAMLEYAQKEM